MQTTLPWSWYSDPQLLVREQERIFRSSWQYVGHTHQLREPGSFVSGNAGLTPVVVVRGRDTKLRAFLNVCRHRGYPVVQGAGRRETLQCAYHAWTYDLDGSLRAAPRAEQEPDFDRGALGLCRVQLDTWGPFVFVNPDPAAGPLADALGALPQQIAELGLDLDSLVFHHRWEAELAANWKVVAENFLECYHCPTAHPGFSKVIDTSPDGYRLESEGLLSTQFGTIRDDARADYDLDGEIRRSQFHFLWPNLGINVFPGRPNISIGPINPIGPDRTARFLDYFFGPEVDEEWIAQLLEFDDQVGVEDRELVEGVQRGMAGAAGALDRGVLMSRSEGLIAHFQGLTEAALLPD